MLVEFKIKASEIVEFMEKYDVNIDSNEEVITFKLV